MGENVMSTRDYENETWEEWDNGTFGQSEEHVRVSSVDQNLIDESLSLQSISIRMPKDLLEDLKLIAGIHGVGYQPLIKQLLQRFVTCELKQMLRDKADREAARKALAEEEKLNQPPIQKTA
jgi:predicted DNA binding CopG/RHH family protein